jgi:hypothetical protein
LADYWKLLKLERRIFPPTEYTHGYSSFRDAFLVAELHPAGRRVGGSCDDVYYRP